ncbi:MAG: hypothetical protein IPL10_05370 [Bacteroidetes bacterium]|nr:hypothetical protein [Bacteroidota bacterium]
MVTFGCDVYNDITLSTTPTISPSDAIKFAQTGLGDLVASTSVKNELFVLPIPEFKQNIYKLVYEVTMLKHKMHQRSCKIPYTGRC